MTTSRMALTHFISLVSTVLFLIFGRNDLFISMLGFAALGLESTLPIPQLIRYGVYVMIPLVKI
jgi:hypothetical protein